MLESGRFAKGRKLGIWNYWNKNGEQIRTEKYSEDIYYEPSVYCNIFSPDGNSYGLMKGLDIYCNPDGNYEHYYKDGEWIYKNKSGNISKTEIYNNGKLVDHKDWNYISNTVQQC